MYMSVQCVELNRCEECWKEFPVTELVESAEGNLVCPACVDSYVTCYDCDEFLHKDNAYYMNDLCAYLCPTCHTNNTDWCSICDELFHQKNLVMLGEYQVCPDCQHELVKCPGCGEYFPEHELHSLGVDLACSACYANAFAELTAEHDDGDDFPFFDLGEDEPFYIGAELEVDRLPLDEDRWGYQDLLKLASYCKEQDRRRMYIQEEPSVSYGFELVTQPFSYHYHMEAFPWHEVLDILKDMGFDPERAKTCGLHFHVDYDYFGRDKEEQEAYVYRLIYLVEKFWSKLWTFSRREECQLRWIRPYGLVVPFDAFRAHAQNFEDTRYRPVAFNYYTVEFRLFRGTLERETFLASLQLVKLLCETVKELSLQELERLTWTAFCLRGQEYPELMSYLKKRGLLSNEKEMRIQNGTVFYGMLYGEELKETA